MAKLEARTVVKPPTINGSKRLLVGLVGLIGDVKRLEPMPKLDFVTSTIT